MRPTRTTHPACDSHKIRQASSAVANPESSGPPGATPLNLGDIRRKASFIPDPCPHSRADPSLSDPSASSFLARSEPRSQWNSRVRRDDIAATSGAQQMAIRPILSRVRTIVTQFCPAIPSRPESSKSGRILRAPVAGAKSSWTTRTVPALIVRWDPLSPRKASPTTPISKTHGSASPAAESWRSPDAAPWRTSPSREPDAWPRRLSPSRADDSGEPCRDPSAIPDRPRRRCPRIGTRTGCGTTCLAAWRTAACGLGSRAIICSRSISPAR